MIGLADPSRSLPSRSASDDGLRGPAQLARVAASPQSAVGRTRSADERFRAVRRTLLVVLALNLIVTIAKVVVGARTHTLTVLGAALESGLDVLNNLVGMMLIAVASRAPDENHPYGHDKFETVGALGIVVFLSISCFELIRQGIAALMTRRVPHPASPRDMGIVAATLAVNAFVVWYERKRGRELGSTFLLADAAHTGSDILVTLLALASLAISRIERPWIDAALAITVALIIAWSGFEVLRQSIPVLVDERAIDAARLRAVVLGVADIQDVRNIRSRSTPSGQLFAEVTIAVVGTTPVEAAHHLADAVEAAIEREFGTSQVTVHVEPV